MKIAVWNFARLAVLALALAAFAREGRAASGQEADDIAHFIAACSLPPTRRLPR